MGSCSFPDRAVLSVEGADAGPFLDNLVTVLVSDLPAKTARFTALLTPQGKIIVDFFVVRSATGYVIDCPRALAADLLKKLTLYRLRAKVDLADRSTDLMVVAGWDDAPRPDGLVYDDPRLPALGWRAIITVDQASTFSGTTEEYDAHRIALGVPQGGRDFIYGDAFPHETLMDCLHAIDFKKGCYVGQEVVSRMEHRATARTRIVPVSFVDGIAPPEGTEAYAGDRLLGRIGSVASGGKALAMLRLDRFAEADPQQVQAGGLAFHVETRDFMSFKVTPNA